jgi:hypothetical protein
MSPTEFKMQPTIHFKGKAGHLPSPGPVLRSKCIVGCILIPSGSSKILFKFDTFCIICNGWVLKNVFFLNKIGLNGEKKIPD